MGWFIGSVIFTILLVICLVVGIALRRRAASKEAGDIPKHVRSDEDEDIAGKMRRGQYRTEQEHTRREENESWDTRRLGWVIITIGIILFVIWFGAITPLRCFKQVTAGHIGITYTFGNITGQTGEGGKWIAPWQKMRIESFQIIKYGTADIPRDIIQKISSAESAVPEGHMGAASIDTQDVFVKATLNLQIPPSGIQNLYRYVGPNWKEVLVASRLLNFFKEETVKYKTTDVIPSRETIRVNVRNRLQDELSIIEAETLEGKTVKIVIKVGDLLIDNISFRPEFLASIENKQIAKQDAMREEAKVETYKQIGEQAKAQAEGDAGAIKIRADAEKYRTMAIGDGNAYVNNVVGKSLENNPSIIPYTLAQKLSENINVALLPTGQQFLIDLKSLGLTEVTPTPTPTTAGK